jgi:hypothetical protein
VRVVGRGLERARAADISLSDSQEPGTQWKESKKEQEHAEEKATPEEWGWKLGAESIVSRCQTRSTSRDR